MPKVLNWERAGQGRACGWQVTLNRPSFTQPFLWWLSCLVSGTSAGNQALSVGFAAISAGELLPLTEATGLACI